MRQGVLHGSRIPHAVLLLFSVPVMLLDASEQCPLTESRPCHMMSIAPSALLLRFGMQGGRHPYQENAPHRRGKGTVVCMAMYELRNEEISVAVDSRGAELKSLRKASTGTEYMWCGDARYWERTSPILFPFVGGLRDRKYRFGGRTYSMPQHGFARNMEFSLLSQDSCEIWFELRSSRETLENYPFVFILKAGYRIEGSRLTVLWQVENPGQEVLHFSIGGHPAFNCPLETGMRQNECFVEFAGADEVSSTQISGNGLALPGRDLYRLDGGRLALTDHLFDHDALVVEGNQTDTVALCGRDGARYVTLTMEAPLFGIWSPAGKQAPFVCIEPWYGRCDAEDFAGTLEQREWGNQVAPGGVWKASYAISI